jgi:twitching motility protein PilT
MTEPCHILTLEDPIEYQYQNQMCTVNQRGLGLHFRTFASAMRAALREDPDVILIGEMRDAETVGLAIKAAETGHLVLSTLHTGSAAKAVDRMINCFPAAEQPQIRTVLSETLKMVIAQRLLPTADRKRRIPVHEILVNNSAIANLVREGKTFQIPSIMQTGAKEGMQVFDTGLLNAANKGEIDGKLAYELSNEKKAFAKWAPTGAAPAAHAAPPQPQPAAPGAAAAQQPGLVKKAA